MAWGHKITLHVYVEGPHDEKLIDAILDAVPDDDFAVAFCGMSIEDVEEEPLDQVGT